MPILKLDRQNIPGSKLMRCKLILWTIACALLLGAIGTERVLGAEKYDGPRPPKPDLLYLMHADTLVPVETADAKEESGKKDESNYSVPGPNSSARTPLAEPIFLLQSEKILPDRLELYKFDVKNGHRELSISKNRRKGTRALHVSVTKLDGALYKVEASEPLENGQYSLSPTDSNKVFCFEVY